MHPKISLVYGAACNAVYLPIVIVTIKLVDNRDGTPQTNPVRTCRAANRFVMVAIDTV